MDFSKRIGDIVVNRNAEQGVLEEASDYLSVNYGDIIRKYQLSAFEQGYLQFLRIDLQQLVENEKEEHSKMLEKEQETNRIITASATKNSFDGLRFGEECVSNVAEEIYVDCCNRFGWNLANRGQYAKQKKLYSKHATQEDYSVLFLSHSNWTKTQGSHWSNEISMDTTKICEHWHDNLDDTFYHDSSTRVIFAKNRQGTYLFLGVYQCSNIDKLSKTKDYEMISNFYPPFEDCSYGK